MAKTYRKATEKDISKGKGKSTDELSLAEATAYFNKRAGETGAKKFRYKGEVYDLSGNKSTVETIKPSTKAATPKPSKPAAPEKTVNTVRPEAPKKSRTTGGGGADHMPATGVAKPKSYTSSGRGNGASEVSRRKTDAARQEMSDRAKKVAAGGAALGAAVVGARAAMKGAPKAPRPVAKPTVSNPSYKGGSKMKEGFQGKMETGIARPGSTPKGNFGAGGRLGGSITPRLGGTEFEMIDRARNPFNFSKGGMVKKGKK